jgi:RNA polymerase-binding transcription factor DksA
MARQKATRKLTKKQIEKYAILLTQEQLNPHGYDILKEIHDALNRVTEGTYGVCLGTGKPINNRRLKAIPWAKYSIEHARLMEQPPEYLRSDAEFPDDPDAYAA